VKIGKLNLQGINKMTIFEYQERIKVMEIRKKQTAFMEGNIDLDGIVYHIFIDTYGHAKFFASGFDTEAAIYSNGFIDAIEDGKIPTLDLLPTDSHRFYNELEEYHHVIINDECFNVYFKN
jgi:hypothetical protein